MPLKSENRRVEVPLSEAQHEALKAFAKGKSLAAVVRQLLIKYVPDMPDDLTERGKYKRESD